MSELPKPYAWWVQLRVVPTAPDILVLYASGSLRGIWVDEEGSHSGRLLDDEDMRFYGFERCFCGPTDPQADPDCPAHQVLELTIPAVRNRRQRTLVKL